MAAPRAASRSIPHALSLRELESLSRRYMQEMIPFVGPHIDVMAPDMGTNEQVMAWFMDTYSMYQGVTVTEIVTGKPVGSGGTLGPARGDRPRRRVPGVPRDGAARRSSPTGATAIVQGFGNVGSHAALGLAAARRQDRRRQRPHRRATTIPTGLDVRGAGATTPRSTACCRASPTQPRSTRASC